MQTLAILSKVQIGVSTSGSIDTQLSTASPTGELPPHTITLTGSV